MILPFSNILSMSYFDIITLHIPEENRGARDREGLERVRM